MKISKNTLTHNAVGTDEAPKSKRRKIKPHESGSFKHYSGDETSETQQKATTSGIHGNPLDDPFSAASAHKFASGLGFHEDAAIVGTGTKYESSEYDNKRGKLNKKRKKPDESNSPAITSSELLNQQPEYDNSYGDEPQSSSRILYAKGEFITVLSPEDKFYLCRCAQTVNSSTKRFKIRWLEGDNNLQFVWSYYDSIDRECVLTNVKCHRLSNSRFEIDPADLQRTESLLRKSLQRVVEEDAGTGGDEVRVETKFIKSKRRYQTEYLVKQKEPLDAVEVTGKVVKPKHKAERVRKRGAQSGGIFDIVDDSGEDNSSRKSDIIVKKADKLTSRSADTVKPNSSGEPPANSVSSPVNDIAPSPQTNSRYKLPQPMLYYQWKDAELSCCRGCKRKQIIQSVINDDLSTLMKLCRESPRLIAEPRSPDVPLSALHYAVKHERIDALNILLGLLFVEEPDSSDCLTEPARTAHQLVHSDVARYVCEINSSEKLLRILVKFTDGLEASLWSFLATALQRGNRMVAAAILQLRSECGSTGGDGSTGSDEAVCLEILSGSEGCELSGKPGAVTVGAGAVTPIHCACIASNRLLREYWSERDFRAVDARGARPLHYAAVAATSENLEFLISKGVGVADADVKGETALMWAAKAGRTKNVTALLGVRQAEELVNKANTSGMTALHLASRNGHSKIVQLLLRHRADTELSAIGGITPVMLAAKHGHLSVLHHLVKGDAKVNRPDDAGRNCLHFAATNSHLQILDFLLQPIVGASNAPDREEFLPLHLAASRGWLGCVRRLVEAGHPVNALNVHGESPCALALTNGHVQSVLYIMQLPQFTANTKSSDILNLLALVCRFCPVASVLGLVLDSVKDVEISLCADTAYNALSASRYPDDLVDAAAQLLAKGFPPGFLPPNSSSNSHLFVAASSGNLSLVNWFLSHEQTVADTTDSLGNNFLHLIGINCKQTHFVELLSQLEVYINSESNVNSTKVLKLLAVTHNTEGFSPLLQSYKSCKDSVANVIIFAKFLVSSLSVNINETGPASDGSNSLLNYLILNNCEISLIRELLKLPRVDTNRVDGGGVIPLELAIRHPNSKELMGALIAYGATVHGKQGGPVLLQAAKLGHIDEVRVLLENKAVPYGSDGEGRTLFHHLASCTNPNTMNCIQLAVSRNGTTQLNAKDNQGQTALHIAVDRSPELVPVLLAAGCDPNATDHLGRTALFYAFSKPDPTPVVRTLLTTMNQQSLHMCTPNGVSALHAASEHGSLSSSLYLLQRSALVTCTCVEAAIRNKHPALTLLLLQNISKEALEQTPPRPLALFTLLVEERWLDLCHLLLDRVPQIDARAILSTLRARCYRLALRLIQTCTHDSVTAVSSTHNRTLLHRLALNPPDDLQPLVASELIRLNVPLNAVDDFGCSALHYATYNGSSSLFNFFTNFPSSDLLVNSPDLWGRTVFAHALWADDPKSRDHVEIVRSLTAKDSNPNRLMPFPSHKQIPTATQSDNRWLNEEFLNSCPKYTLLMRALHINWSVGVDLILKSSQLDVSVADGNGFTVLIWSIKQKNPSLFDKLVAHPSVVRDHTDNEGNSYAHHAVLAERSKVFYLERLGAAGYPLNLTNEQTGRTPSTEAASINATECVHLLATICDELSPSTRSTSLLTPPASLFSFQ